MLGETPAENERVLRRMVFVREDQAYPDFKVRHALRAASWFWGSWTRPPGRGPGRLEDVLAARTLREIARRISDVPGPSFSESVRPAARPRPPRPGRPSQPASRPLARSLRQQPAGHSSSHC